MIAAVGAAKESIGKLTGNTRYQAEGALERKEGQVSRHVSTFTQSDKGGGCGA